MSPEKANTQDKNIDSIKAYITPGLISIIGFFLWNELSEMKQDIKVLIKESSGNEVKISTMQHDIIMLKSAIYTDYRDNQVNIKQPAKKEDEIEIR
jgi:hypothetical protein